ncbi:M10 family metallopeptidase C-terminal domain-containing protein [Hyphomonas sp.]|jgi:Ca2+-binding RTX toxin-like protein|uniref:M10 family metallopeptidase C-terminal domain-containing protein n=1 Tax=Hyphomonas sp. TaxID=87 RepID=UPI0037BE29AF
MDFRSLEGVDFFGAARFNIGAVPVFHAPLDTSFEILERGAIFAYRTHALSCCPCGQDHSAELLAHKSAVAAGALQAQGPSFPVNAPAGSPQAANFDYPGEIPGDVSTTFTLNIGDTIVSQVETSGDQDWFMIELQAGVTYEFALNGTGATPLGDPFLEIMSSAGVQLKTNDDGGPDLNSLLRFTPTTSGVYFINAHGWVDANGATGTGSYSLSAALAPPLPTYTIGQIAQYLANGSQPGLGPRWPSNTITYNIEDLNTDERAMAERALDMWAAVTPLTFVRTTGAANITFVNSEADDPNATGDGDPSAYARTSTSGSSITSSLIVISSNWAPPNPTSSSGWFDSYAQQTYIHEIGHALGFGHSGPYNSTADYGTDNIYINDIMAYTVMSYFDQLETGFGSFRYVLGLQQADIAAAQLLYGANPAGTFNGNTTFGFNSSAPGTNIDWSQYVLVSGVTYLRPPSMTIYDTGGVDTINLSGFAQPQILDLRPGTFSSLGDRPGQTPVHYVNVVAIAEGTIIENAIGGSGADRITGNSANNTITLGAGADTFVYAAGGGADTITDFAVSVDRLDLTAFSSADALAAFNGRTSSAGGTLLTFGAGQTILLQGVNTGQLTQSNLVLSGSPPPPPSVGTTGDDVLYGSASNDEIQGLAGNDTIYGLDGADVLYGGDGNDTLVGDAGNDNLNGDAGDDVLYGGTGDDTITGGTGADNIFGGDGSNTLYGGSGNDVITGGSGNDVAYGEDGDDAVYGGSGNDILVGGAGADSLYGELGVDTLYGGAGNDTLRAGEGNDTVFGEGDNDSLYGDDGDDLILGGDGDDLIIGGLGTDVLRGEAGIDQIYAGEGNDTLEGGLGTDFLYGEAGNDALYGGDAADTLSGGAGLDNLFGDAGTDTLYGGLDNDTLSGGTEADVLYGELGDDVLYGGAGNDSLLGGDNNDTLYGEDGDDLLIGGTGVDLLTGGLGNDVLQGNEGDDTIYGDEGNDQIFGGLGNDTLHGGAGADSIYGEGGSNIVYAGAGADLVIGGDSSDVLYGEDDNDVIYAGLGADTLLGGAGIDTLYGEAGSDTLYGGADNDTLVGGDDNDALYGEAGIDTLYGGNGNDSLLGGDGNDNLFGDAGADLLSGGLGNDLYVGGSGADTFVVESSPSGTVDRLFDFTQGEDVIRLVGSGFSSFAQVQGAMTTSGANTIITFSTGAQLRIDGKTPGQFTSADFVLAASAEAPADPVDAKPSVNTFEPGAGPDHDNSGFQLPAQWGAGADVFDFGMLETGAPNTSMFGQGEQINGLESGAHFAREFSFPDAELVFDYEAIASSGLDRTDLVANHTWDQLA